MNKLVLLIAILFLNNAWADLSTTQDAVEDVVADIWDGKADEWDIFVGDDGERDLNRRYQSDPALDHLLGDVQGKVLLDAGCGTGYLARRYSRLGAKVVAVDISPEMIRVAQSKPNAESIVYAVDSISTLSTLDDQSVDLIVANYVLMDTPDLDKALAAFHRVLKPSGRAIVVFLHPCFPLQETNYDAQLEQSHITWKESYFQEQPVVVPPWTDVFSSSFMVFHRPLSAYFHAFSKAGFRVADMVEPVIDRKDAEHLPDGLVRMFEMTPISIMFALEK